MTPFNDETKLNSSLTEWSQTVPSNMPWIENHLNDNRAIMQSYNHYNPSVMQFSGICAPNHHLQPNYNNFSNNIHLYQNMCRKPIKRSNDCIEDEFETDNRRPIKHHITEDKVAAIFDNLCIDECRSKSSVSYSDDESLDEQLLDCDSRSNKDSQLIMTDEVQNAITVEDLTNRLIKDEFDKLSKAVVVWTPQFSHIRDQVFGRQTDSEEDSESSSDDNATKHSSINANLNDNIEVEFMPIEEIDNQMEFCT